MQVFLWHIHMCLNQKEKKSTQSETREHPDFCNICYQISPPFFWQFLQNWQ